FSQGDIVVRMLTIARLGPFRLKESVGRQFPGLRCGLEVGEFTKVTIGRAQRVREIRACERWAIVPVDHPIDVRIRQMAENALYGKRRDVGIAHLTLRGRGAHESTIGHGLGGNRSKLVIAYRKSARQTA